MNADALNSLWIYLQSLQLTQSNRRWLAERLLESITDSVVEEDETEYARSNSEVQSEWAEALKELENGEGTVYDSPDEFFSKFM